MQSLNIYTPSKLTCKHTSMTCIHTYIYRHLYDVSTYEHIHTRDSLVYLSTDPSGELKSFRPIVLAMSPTQDTAPDTLD